jgi:hypothetical protein
VNESDFKEKNKLRLGNGTTGCFSLSIVCRFVLDGDDWSPSIDDEDASLQQGNNGQSDNSQSYRVGVGQRNPLQLA